MNPGAVWDDPDNVGASAEFLVESLLGVAGSDPSLVLLGEARERQHVGGSVAASANRSASCSRTRACCAQVVLGPEPILTSDAPDSISPGNSTATRVSRPARMRPVHPARQLTASTRRHRRARRAPTSSPSPSKHPRSPPAVDPAKRIHALRRRPTALHARLHAVPRACTRVCTTSLHERVSMKYRVASRRCDAHIPCGRATRGVAWVAGRTPEPGPTAREGGTGMEAIEERGIGDRLVWSVEEAAALLGISRAHAYELVARGELTHVRLGRRIVVPKRAL